MLIESTPRVAVPVSLSVQDVKPGAAAFASALQLMTVGEINSPFAVPVNFRSFGQVALNEPRADVAVCSLTVHLKSVHVLGVGMSCDDVQLPRSELLPAAEGSVSELLCSNRAHAEAADAATARRRTRNLFIMTRIRIIYRAHAAREIVVGEDWIIAPQFLRQRAVQ